MFSKHVGEKKSFSNKDTFEQRHMNYVIIIRAITEVIILERAAKTIEKLS